MSVTLPEVLTTMRVPALLSLCAIGVGLVAMPASASHVRRGPTSPRSHHAHGKTKAQVSTHPRAMDDERASEIQTALVKAGYLQSPSGHWDEASADAMRKMQADNGWQTKMIPDSRALIKLGLGPGADTAGGSQPASNVNAALD